MCASMQMLKAGCSTFYVASAKAIQCHLPCSIILTRRVYATLKACWAQKGFGTTVCGSATLNSTHAMFADDVTLFAANRAQLLSMIRDVRHELAKHGLNLNMDKCLIQTNMPGVTVAPIKVDGTEIPMVCASKGFKILGTQYTLVGRCSAEIRARIKMAWGKFHQLWLLLGKRDGNLNKRLRLFDASVTQTVLWCCESWLITQPEK